MRTSYASMVVTCLAVLGITFLGLQFTAAPLSGQDKDVPKNQHPVKDGEKASDKPLPIDLLKVANPEKNSCKGKWEFQGKALVSTPAGQSILEIPHAVPEEYTLKLQVERKAGNDALALGLVVGDRRCLVVLDAGPKIGYVSGLEMIDGQHCAANETTRKGRIFKERASSEVHCTVRRGSITVAVDGKSLIEYKGTWDRLSLGDFWKTPSDRVLFVGSQNTAYRITRMELTAISETATAKRDPVPKAEPIAKVNDDLTHKLNTLAEWSIIGGEWKKDGEGIIGRGNSLLQFKGKLPSDLQLEFDMTVIAGCRPRVHFNWHKFWPEQGNSHIYFGTEGERLTLFPFGRGLSDVTGTAVEYRNNEKRSHME